MSESELQRLSSDELIDYIREATDAGRADCAQSGLAILCYRHFDDVVRRIALRVPREEVEDQAMIVMLAAIKSAFDGTSIGEFRVWLNRIIDRRGIADFHRDREDKPAGRTAADRAPGRGGDLGRGAVRGRRDRRAWSYSR